MKKPLTLLLIGILILSATPSLLSIPVHSDETSSSEFKLVTVSVIVKDSLGFSVASAEVEAFSEDWGIRSPGTRDQQTFWTTDAAGNVSMIIPSGLWSFFAFSQPNYANAHGGRGFFVCSLNVTINANATITLSPSRTITVYPKDTSGNPIDVEAKAMEANHTPIIPTEILANSAGGALTIDVTDGYAYDLMLVRRPYPGADGYYFTLKGIPAGFSGPESFQKSQLAQITFNAYDAHNVPTSGSVEVRQPEYDLKPEAVVGFDVSGSTTLYFTPGAIQFDYRFATTNWNLYLLENNWFNLTAGTNQTINFGGSFSEELQVIPEASTGAGGSPQFNPMTQIWLKISDSYGHILNTMGTPTGAPTSSLTLFQNGATIFNSSIPQRPGMDPFATKINTEYQASNSPTFSVNSDLGPFGQFKFNGTLISDATMYDVLNITTKHFNAVVPAGFPDPTNRTLSYMDKLYETYQDMLGAPIDGQIQYEVDLTGGGFWWENLPVPAKLLLEMEFNTDPLSPASLFTASHEFGHTRTLRSPTVIGMSVFGESIPSLLAIEGISRIYGPKMWLYLSGLHDSFFYDLRNNNVPSGDTVETSQFVLAYIERTFGWSVHKQVIAGWSGAFATSVQKLEDNGFTQFETLATLYSYVAKSNLGWLFDEAGLGVTEARVSQGLALVGNNNISNNPIDYRIATNNIQINAISYLNGLFLIGGIDTPTTPLLTTYSESTGHITPISNLLPPSFKQVTSIITMNQVFYIAGISKSSDYAFCIYNPSTNTVTDLKSPFGQATFGPGLYAMTTCNNKIYLGGYYQASSAAPIFWSYDPGANSVSNLTSSLPWNFRQILSLSSSNSSSILVGACSDVWGLLDVYNPQKSTFTDIQVPQTNHAIMNSLSYGSDGGYLAVGATDYGGEIIRIFGNGTIQDLSAPVAQSTYEVLTINSIWDKIVVGGWGLNGTFLAQLNPITDTTTNISTASTIWSQNGCEAFALCLGSTTALVGGAITTQFGNYSGCTFAALQSNLQLNDLTSLFPKSYTDASYSTLSEPNFYFYADPNYVYAGSELQFKGQNLTPNSLDQLSLAGQSFTVRTNSLGNLSYFVSIPPQTQAGDYLVTLMDNGRILHNWIVVLYNYTTLYPGANMPHMDSMGYPLLKSGGAVRYGDYIEFIRFVGGEIPANSLNYLVQWTEITYPTPQNPSYHVGGNDPQWSSEYSLTAISIFYSPWTLGSSKIETNGSTSGLNSGGSRLYFNSNMMILWVPVAMINETSFNWEYATDYVQNAPFYTPEFRLESGQPFLSFYNGSVRPSINDGTSPPPTPNPTLSPTSSAPPSPAPTYSPTSSPAPTSTPQPSQTPTSTPTYPYVDLTPIVNGSTLYLNGIALPRKQGAVITQISFDWGDGTIYNSWFAQTHTYNYGGTYNVTVSASDNYGDVGFASVLVTVQGPAPTSTPSPTLTPSPTATSTPPIIPELRVWIVLSSLGLALAFGILYSRRPKHSLEGTLNGKESIS
jgi:hypothetical protein